MPAGAIYRRLNSTVENRRVNNVGHMAERAPLVTDVGTLIVKSHDAAARTFSGVASTPELDRQGHVLDPFGALFRNPIPLLLHHDTEKPIGTVRLFGPTAAGIAFEATLPTIDEAGELRDRITLAWQSIKAGILSGVSIGFRLIGDACERIPGGGLKLLKTEILELSLVTIPANASASILCVKSLSAATGQAPGVTGSAIQPGARAPVMETITDQIKASEASRAAKAARMIELMNTAGAAGTTLDELQQKEYDGLDGDVRKVDDHLVRLRRVETLHVASATPLPSAVGPAAGAELRGGVSSVSIKPNVPKGHAFIRAVCAKAAANGDTWRALQIAEQWRDSTPEVELYIKAAIAPGGTTDPAWAGALAAVNNMRGDFLELLRPATIIGKIPNLHTAPFNAAIPIQTAGGVYGWVGQGAPKGVTKAAYGTVTLGVSKAAGIIVLTEELVKLSNPSAEDTVRREMIAGIAKFLDQQFIDPAVAAVLNVSPASITNGTTAIASTGNALEDIAALVATFTAADVPLEGVALIMSPTNAFTLGIAQTATGSPMFPGVGAGGGNLLGINVITSTLAGTNVILVQPDYILYADEGGVQVDVSREASVQMDSAPDNPATGTTVLTSLWQNNLVGLRAERWVNWVRAILPAVKYVSGATYTPVFAAPSINGGASARKAANARVD
jgi:HK97 family phage major capsid protein/HK97 family phage prohead protease